VTKDDESEIRRCGFPINREDAKNLLRFIDYHNPSHDMIEPWIYVKLELLAGKYWIRDVKITEENKCDCE